MDIFIDIISDIHLTLYVIQPKPLGGRAVPQLGLPGVWPPRRQIAAIRGRGSKSPTREPEKITQKQEGERTVKRY
jgi:hypothetical protein